MVTFKIPKVTPCRRSPISCTPNLICFPAHVQAFHTIASRAIQQSSKHSINTMAPLNITGDANSPLLPASNSSAAADNTTIATRDPYWPDHSTGSTDYTREIDHKTTAAAIIVSVILAIILAIIFYRCMQRILVGSDPDPDPALAMPRGHVYGHDNASAHEMRPMRSGSSYGRPAFREVEDRAAGSGGSTVARPAPAVTHPLDGQGTPPPPCK